MAFWHNLLKFQICSSKNFKMQSTSRKKLVIPNKKTRGKDGPIYLLQQNVSVELHIIQILKQYHLELDEAGTAI